jgi:hypothetical protein
MNLIDEDALLEEIEKQIELGKFKCQQSQENNDRESYVAWSEHIATCGKIFSFINTLEVKEVDLEKEIKDYLHKQPIVARSNGTDFQLVPSPMEIAKYAFELGLKAQKGE